MAVSYPVLCDIIARHWDMLLGVRGHRLYCERRGQGKPVLFIHGLGGSSSIWFAQAEALSSSFHATTYDWLGSGCSDKPNQQYSIEDWVEEAAALCDALDISGAGVVGHSMGCAVAITLAARHPRLVAALVLLGPVTKLGEPGVKVITERAAAVRSRGMQAVVDGILIGALAAETRETNPAVHGLFRGSLLANDPEFYASHCEALLRTDADVIASEVRAPTVIIGGDADPTAPPAAISALAARIPDARSVQIGPAGHAMQLDQPAEVSRIVSEFFTEQL